MAAAILIALIGVFGTVAAAIITVRLGRVERNVDGGLDKLLNMISERDATIEQLLRERDDEQ